MRRYWVLGMECSLPEIQKLAWLLQRAIEQHQQDDILNRGLKLTIMAPMRPI
ncbi:hypothetical protein OH690_00205 [Escherichia coli]|nr:hypothetical protein [Escherichia coli]